VQVLVRLSGTVVVNKPLGHQQMPLAVPEKEMCHSDKANMLMFVIVYRIGFYHPRFASFSLSTNTVQYKLHHLPSTTGQTAEP